MEDALGKISQRLDKLETIYQSALNLLEDKDKVINEKDARIRELTDKVMELTRERDLALKSKIETLEALTNEREEFHKKLLELNRTVLEQKEKIAKLKEKKRQVQDSIMGSSFEIDKLRKEFEEKERQLKELEERLASFASGDTGVFYDLDSLLSYFRKRIPSANRSLRLIIPEVEFLHEHSLISLLNELNENVVVNIASSFDLEKDKELIKRWKDRGFKLTNYEGHNLIAISVNGLDVGVAYIKENNVAGFYTVIPELTTLFKNAVMDAFVKGKKI